MAAKKSGDGKKQDTQADETMDLFPDASEKQNAAQKRPEKIEPASSEFPPPTNNGKEESFHLPDGPFRQIVDNNFVQYASYYILERAFPHLDDGLKPVQRRILHSLWENDDGKFNKVANIVGHCMRYHPHGDAPIADALVNLANKDFLIEKQGNYGNILTGDGAAASRYIECRLTELARKEVFNPKLTRTILSYDGRHKEPVTLPCKLPLLLMQGAEGIGVGLSTRTLPHNFLELLKAQVAILSDKRFKILPDFPQGGLMDPSEYAKGLGKIKVRAVIETKDHNKLIIREIPFGTTTESLMGSIEDAARKKKIKIRSVNNFTAENVEILITLSQGEDPDKAVQALYHFTQCEISISSNPIVIQDDKPVQMTVDEILRANTDNLVKILKAELELRQRQLEDELHFKTLVQIFIENRIYKAIETCSTYEAVQKAVFKGLEPFKKKLRRPVTTDDVEMLLELRIKRISKFDINKNKEDIEKILEELKQVAKNLKNLTPYAIDYLQGLIEKYAKKCKRRTKLTTTEEVDVRELTANELAICYDREKGFLGHQVRGEVDFRCSSLDKILIVWKDGRYRVIPPPDKLFVDKNVAFFEVFERDKEFVAVYATAKASFIKRFTFGGVILNREYNCIQPKARMLLFTDKPVRKLSVKFRPSKGLRIKEQEFALSDVPVRGVKTKGNQLSKKPISSLKAV